MDLNDAINTFFHECHELLTEMESALLELERDPENKDLMNAIFRAAHTIKGTSGVFGFDNIVAFTHVAENVLDRVRADEIGISDNLIALLLECRDHIGTLVESTITKEDLSPCEKCRLDI